MQFTGIPISTLLTLGGIAAGLLTLLYILKLRKRRIEVPFSHLWGRVLEKRTRESDLWRKLRRLLSWLLHLIMAGLIIFALADPHPEEEVVRGRHVLLLLDSSASMAATDVSGGVDRMDIAKKRAADILDTVGPEDRVMLVHFNDQLQPLSPFVTEPSILEQPLREIEVAATGTNFEEALAFAADSLQDKENGLLVLISDGAGLEDEVFDELDFSEQTTIRHVKLGESAGNVAVTGFNVRRYLANKLDYEIFAQVKNQFERSVEAELQIYADGRQVDAKQLTLEPGQTIQKFYPSQAVSGERLEARIKLLSRDARDVFPLDDRAFALLPPIRKTKVLAVSDGNLFLEGPLLLNPNLNVERVSPGSYEASMSQDYDLTIFDSIAPQTPERGNFVYFDPPEDGPWEITGTTGEPIITSVKKSHPLMRWITFKDLNIGAASKVRLDRGDEVVASSFGNPLFVTRKQDGKHLVGVLFDIRNSDLPLRVAFPVMMINIVDYFTLDDESYVPNYETGKTWSIPVDSDDGTAQVTAPNGEAFDAAIYQGKAVFYGSQTGFYRIQGPETTQFIAANLSSTQESRIKPGEISLPAKNVENDTSNLLFERSEWWIWAVLGLLLLVLIEWATYNRRVTV
ncbi:MAG: vWA domain-containing protein [Myxococcota bacterium]